MTKANFHCGNSDALLFHWKSMQLFPTWYLGLAPLQVRVFRALETGLALSNEHLLAHINCYALVTSFQRADSCHMSSYFEVSLIAFVHSITVANTDIHIPMYLSLQPYWAKEFICPCLFSTKSLTPILIDWSSSSWTRLLIFIFSSLSPFFSEEIMWW